MKTLLVKQHVSNYIFTRTHPQGQHLEGRGKRIRNLNFALATKMNSKSAYAT